jgi:hypothetical protein
MDPSTRTRLQHALMWLCWLIALLGLASLYHVPLERVSVIGKVELALPVAGGVTRPTAEPTALWRKVANRKHECCSKFELPVIRDLAVSHRIFA